MSWLEHFAWPAAWWGVPAALVLWWAFRRMDAGRARQLGEVLGASRAVEAARADAGRRRLRGDLFGLGLLAAAIALMQPLWGLDLRRVEQRGLDLTVCLDVSRSMLARDVEPDRLRRAQQEIVALAGQLRGDRLALIAFAGDARLVVPLTRDMDSFATLVKQADPLSVRSGGTDLGAALDRALAAMPEDAGRNEVILLITDGEDLEQRGLRAAERCRERGVVVHCVGFGSAFGSKITIVDGDGERFLRDRAGREVVTTMDAASLRAIAETAGGRFVDAQVAARPLLGLYDTAIRGLTRSAYVADPRQVRKNRFQWALLLALLLMFCDAMIVERRSS